MFLFIGLDESSQAGYASVTFDHNNGSLTLTILDSGNVDEIFVLKNGTVSKRINKTGDSTRVNVTPETQILVLGQKDGSNTTLYSFKASKIISSPIGSSQSYDHARLLWKADIGGGSVNSAPVVSDDTVYVGDTTLYAFNKSTGAKEWSYDVGNELTSPEVHNGTVFVGSSDGTVHAVDASSGTVEWTKSLDGGIAPNAGANATAGQVYIGSKNGTLYSLDESTGGTTETFSTSGPIKTVPVLSGDFVYVGADGLYAFDALLGTLEWEFKTSTRFDSSPTVDSGTVYAGGENTLYAVDATLGTETWSTATQGDITSSPTIRDGRVYVGSSDGGLYAFDAALGGTEWNSSVNGSIDWSSPTAASDRIYVGDMAQTLSAVNYSTGARNWSLQTKDTIRSSPTVANGVLYIADDSGTIYAFETNHSSNSDGTRCGGKTGNDGLGC